MPNTILWCLILPILLLLPCEAATDEVSPDSSLALPSARLPCFLACTLHLCTPVDLTFLHLVTAPSQDTTTVAAEVLYFQHLGCYQTDDQPASCLLQPMEEAPYVLHHVMHSQLWLLWHQWLSHMHHAMACSFSYPSTNGSGLQVPSHQPNNWLIKLLVIQSSKHYLTYRDSIVMILAG